MASYLLPNMTFWHAAHQVTLAYSHSQHIGQQVHKPVIQSYLIKIFFPS